MTAPDSLRVRRAALLLHSLGPAVRDEVLAKLPPEDIARLRPLLTELADLSASQSANLSAQERVCLMQPETVAWCLQQCSEATAVRMIAAKSWPWRDSVLDHMPEPRRSNLAAALNRNPAPFAPAMLEALCQSLCNEAAVRLTMDPESPGSLFDSVSRIVRGLLPWTR